MDTKNVLPRLIRTSATVSILLCVIALSAHAQWLNYPTAGIPRTPDGKPNLSAPAPRAPDGKPDFSGIWMAEDQKYFMNLAAGLKPEDVPLQPWARALQQQREDNLHADDPLARCLPHGVPRVNTNGLFPFKIIQTAGLVVILYEQMHLFRQVFMDGRKLADDPNPAWLGYLDTWSCRLPSTTPRHTASHGLPPRKGCIWRSAPTFSNSSAMRTKRISRIWWVSK